MRCAAPGQNANHNTPTPRVRYNTKARPPPKCLHCGGMMGKKTPTKDWLWALWGSN